MIHRAGQAARDANRRRIGVGALALPEFLVETGAVAVMRWPGVRRQRKRPAARSRPFQLEDRAMSDDPKRPPARDDSEPENRYRSARATTPLSDDESRGDEPGGTVRERPHPPPPGPAARLRNGESTPGCTESSGRLRSRIGSRAMTSCTRPARSSIDNVAHPELPYNSAPPPAESRRAVPSLRRTCRTWRRARSARSRDRRATLTDDREKRQVRSASDSLRRANLRPHRTNTLPRESVHPLDLAEATRQRTATATHTGHGTHLLCR